MWIRTPPGIYCMEKSILNMGAVPKYWTLLHLIITHLDKWNIENMARTRHFVLMTTVLFHYVICFKLSGTVTNARPMIIGETSGMAEGREDWLRDVMQESLAAVNKGIDLH